MKYFKYHSGDRIGHGIALGLNMKSWCEQHPVVILPRVEYFENLIWMWGKSEDFNIDDYSSCSISPTVNDEELEDELKVRVLCYKNEKVKGGQWMGY